jgi:hypothetical protein
MLTVLFRQLLNLLCAGGSQSSEPVKKRKRSGYRREKTALKELLLGENAGLSRTAVKAVLPMLDGAVMSLS